jgi:hypothetical protein
MMRAELDIPVKAELPERLVENYPDLGNAVRRYRP